MQNKITIFTDGSSRGNPGPGGWGSVVVIAGAHHPSGAEIIELGGRENPTTNNRMELTAALRALENVASNPNLEGTYSVIIYTDSSYLINGITKWVHGWQKRGWITSEKEEVQNRDLWEGLIAADVQAESRIGGGDIEWKYVGGHIGIPGNERCDVIATEFADSTDAKSQPKLFKGVIDQYPIKNILNVAMAEANVEKNQEMIQKKNEQKSRSRAKAYSYISMVDKKIMVHASWAECEARVKGKTGARYKKSLSAADEQAIIAEFSGK